MALKAHENQRNSEGDECEIYVAKMWAKFHDNEFANHMSILVSLKKTTTMDEFYEEFEALLNILHVLEENALSIFVNNLNKKYLNMFNYFTLRI